MGNQTPTLQQRKTTLVVYLWDKWASTFSPEFHNVKHVKLIGARREPQSFSIARDEHGMFWYKFKDDAHERSVKSFLAEMAPQLETIELRHCRNEADLTRVLKPVLPKFFDSMYVNDGESVEEIQKLKERKTLFVDVPSLYAIKHILGLQCLHTMYVNLSLSPENRRPDNNIMIVLFEWASQTNAQPRTLGILMPSARDDTGYFDYLKIMSVWLLDPRNAEEAKQRVSKLVVLIDTKNASLITKVQSVWGAVAPNMTIQDEKENTIFTTGNPTTNKNNDPDGTNETKNKTGTMEIPIPNLTKGKKGDNR
jgi:hypothetical protein